MVYVDPDIWSYHLELIGRKLMLALHYQTFRHPLSKEGRVWLKVMPNGADFEQEWFQTIRDMTGYFVDPIRSNKSLLDQLTIQWDCMHEPRVGLYLLTLQKRLVFVGLTSESPESHSLPELGSIYGPLDHAVSANNGYAPSSHSFNLI